jgi:hypothetical protein
MNSHRNFEKLRGRTRNQILVLRTYGRCQKTYKFLNTNYNLVNFLKKLAIFSMFLNSILNFKYSIVFDVSKYV